MLILVASLGEVATLPFKSTSGHAELQSRQG